MNEELSMLKGPNKTNYYNFSHLSLPLNHDVVEREKKKNYFKFGFSTLGLMKETVNAK